MIRCLHCHAETSNGLALCDLCRRYVGECLDYLPVYFRNLARWRPGRAGSRPVPGSRVLYDGTTRGAGTGDRISDTLDEALTMLMTSARSLVKDRPGFPRPLTLTDAVLCDDLATAYADDLNDDRARLAALLCEGFEQHLTSIATTDWCGELVREVGHHEARLRKLTETSVPGWYAGACRQVVGFDSEGAAVRCEASTYVMPGLTWVRCGRCGASTAARDHLEVVLSEARGWVARPKALAEAVVALVDTEPSVPKLYDRIRQWAKRGDLEAVWRTTRDYAYDADSGRFIVVTATTGQPRYRFGRVLDLALADSGHARDASGRFATTAS